MDDHKFKETLRHDIDTLINEDFVHSLSFEWWEHLATYYPSTFLEYLDILNETNISLQLDLNSYKIMADLSNRDDKLLPEISHLSTIQKLSKRMRTMVDNDILKEITNIAKKS